MAEPKTKRTGASVTAFLDAIEDEKRRADCKAFARVLQKASGEKPAMWGDAIVGFGLYRYPAGKALNDWFLTGLSPRKANITLYVTPGFAGYDAAMAKLGSYKKGVGCLYVKSADDIDHAVLHDLVARSTAWMKERFAEKR